MRPRLAYFLLLAATCAALPSAWAEDPAKIDPSATVEKLAPGPDTTKTVPSVDLKRDDRVQNSRAVLPGLIEEPTAAIADRRAPIDVTETRAKTIIDRKDAPKPEIIAHKDSNINGQTAPSQFRPSPTTLYSKTGMVDKYQQGLRAADTASMKAQPVFNKTTSFDKLNRFIFRRNGPGSEDGPAMVTPAGGAPASAPPPTQPATTGIGVIGVGGVPVMPSR